MEQVSRCVDETCQVCVFDVTIDPRAKLGRTIRGQRRRRMQGGASWTGDERDYTAVFVDIAEVAVGATVV